MDFNKIQFLMLKFIQIYLIIAIHSCILKAPQN